MRQLRGGRDADLGTPLAILAPALPDLNVHHGDLATNGVDLLKGLLDRQWLRKGERSKERSDAGVQVALHRIVLRDKPLHRIVRVRSKDAHDLAVVRKRVPGRV